MSVYDFTVKDNKEQDVSLREYSGKVLLILYRPAETDWVI